MFSPHPLFRFAQSDLSQWERYDYFHLVPRVSLFVYKITAFSADVLPREIYARFRCGDFVLAVYLFRVC